MSDETSVQGELAEVLRASGDSARVLQTATFDERRRALSAIATALRERSRVICEANARDLANGEKNGIGDALLDRLRLTPERIEAIAEGVEAVRDLPDQIGVTDAHRTLHNGLDLTRVRVPLGVVGAIYEARPNVTVDIAALALSTCNAVVLRGGSAAIESNRVLVAAMQDALVSAGLPRNAVQTIDALGRAGASALMQARGAVDVLIPRGSAALIETVVTSSTVPVIETGSGVTHAFLDATSPTERAINIVVNGKTQRPSVCNALEKVLVHEAAAERILPPLAAALEKRGVRLHGDARTRELVPSAIPATEDDWAAEYLSLDIAVRVIADLDGALDHIRRWSTKHTEVIVTDDAESAERFVRGVDAAVVTVNASSRFTDGAEFGLGAEVGISTQKLHARGPMGPEALTTTKWVVRGTGQVRE